MTLGLTGIHRYPIKSCRGESLRSATVEPWGLAGDRRWMLVDDQDGVVTARKHPQLVLVTPRITATGVHVTAPDLAPLEIATPDGSTLAPVRVGSSALDAAPAAEEAHAWFSKVVGRPVRLVYLDDPTRRATDPAYSDATDRVSFADGYPLLLATEESLAAVNDAIAEGPRSDEGPLEMRRFRPSLVVAGAPAWAEDGWRRIRVGAAIFRAVKACDRCVFTTIDPDTGVKGKEPIATLARIRRWDGATWFAVNLIPDTPGVTINVGDQVEILDQVQTGEPLR